MAGKYIVHTLSSLNFRCVEVGECWIWQGGKDGNGRPSARYQGRSVNPRRIVRELKDGRPLEPGEEVACTCGTPACISPSCSVRTDAKGRARIAAERGAFKNPAKNRRGAMTKRAKSQISEDAIAAIRAARTGKEASELTGVSLSHSKAIRRGSARKDYGNPFAGLGA